MFQYDTQCQTFYKTNDENCTIASKLHIIIQNCSLSQCSDEWNSKFHSRQIKAETISCRLIPLHISITEKKKPNKSDKSIFVIPARILYFKEILNVLLQINITFCIFIAGKNLFGQSKSTLSWIRNYYELQYPQNLKHSRARVRLRKKLSFSQFERQKLRRSSFLVI